MLCCGCVTGDRGKIGGSRVFYKPFQLEDVLIQGGC
jgi:hypothetical protein